MTNGNASTDRRYLYDKEWIHLIALAKQSGLSTTEVRLFLKQAALKKVVLKEDVLKGKSIHHASL